LCSGRLTRRCDGFDFDQSLRSQQALHHDRIDGRAVGSRDSARACTASR
jgi:hypothetical protein